MRSRRFDFAVTVVCLSLLGYFGWHASVGPRGYAFHDRLLETADALQGDFATAQQQRIRLEHKVGLMRPESIDPDMLDELARGQLEVTAPNDLVVLSAH